MNLGYFHYAMPSNEPVYAYASGSAEKAALKKAIGAIKQQEHDIPMIIGGKEVRTGNKVRMRPPHELGHTLGYFHRAGREQVSRAIEAALASLKDAMSGDDADAIKEKTNTLAQASMKLGEAMYKAQQAAEGCRAAAADAAAEGAQPQDAHVVDADFEEVDEKKA